MPLRRPKRTPLHRLLNGCWLAAVCLLAAGCDPGSSARVRNGFPYAVTVHDTFIDSTGRRVSLRWGRVPAGGSALFRGRVPFRATSVDLVFTDDAGRVVRRLSTPFKVVQGQERGGTWEVAVGP